ncbi:MAG TPA: alpha/beta fold hydrolase [Myxococcaceae bacterium]|nr:alpha/beta fold hydrolase [Myxococcaceae bacterium]
MGHSIRTAASVLLSLIAVGCAGVPASSEGPAAAWPAKTFYRSIEVNGRRIFYREAGDPDRPTILLLHGYPSSSHTYRELIPLLSGRYHVVAPDNLGSGLSEHPDPGELRFSFDLLASYAGGFIEAKGLRRFVLYMQDFGAPVGFRLAMAHPERLRAVVVQNGNAYLDGLTDARREFFRKAHQDQSEEEARTLAAFVGAEAIRDRQYLRDVPGVRSERISPDAWIHDLAFLGTPRDREIQVQLFRDYQSNIDSYPAWQQFLRERQPPTLIVWGQNDPAFIPAGATAYLRDLPRAELHMLDAGHFAVEEQAVAIARFIVPFMEKLPP